MATDLAWIEVLSMPDDVSIRDARSDEANFAAEMIRKMVVDIARRPRQHQPGRKLPHGLLTTFNLRPPSIWWPRMPRVSASAMPWRGSLLWKAPSSPREPCTSASFTYFPTTDKQASVAGW